MEFMKKKTQFTLLYLHKEKHLNIIAWLLKMKKNQSRNKNITECVEYALKHYTENQEYIIIAKVCITNEDDIPENLIQIISVADNTYLKDYKKTHRSNSLLIEILENSIMLVDDVSKERFLDLNKRPQSRSIKYYDPFENEQYVSNNTAVTSKPIQQKKAVKEATIEDRNVSTSVFQKDTPHKNNSQTQHNTEILEKNKPVAAATEFEKISQFTSNDW